MPKLRERKHPVQYNETGLNAASKPKAQRKRKPEQKEEAQQQQGPPVVYPLPYELTLYIFEELPCPRLKDVGEYIEYQHEISQLALICKGTVAAARAILVRSPFFDYEWNANHDKRVRFLEAIEAAASQETGLTYATKHVGYINYPTAGDTRLSRTSLLDSIMDLTRLTSLTMSQSLSWVHNYHLRRTVPLLEIRNLFRSAGQNLSHLRQLSLEELEIASDDFKATFFDLLALLPALRRLTLRLPIQHGEQIKPPTELLSAAETQIVKDSNLSYLHFDGGNCWKRYPHLDAAHLLKMVPASVVSLALVNCGDWNGSLGVDIWSDFIHLRHLGIDGLSPALGVLPISLLSLRFVSMSGAPLWCSQNNQLQRLFMDFIDAVELLDFLECPGMANVRLLQYEEALDDVLAHAQEEETIFLNACRGKRIATRQGAMSLDDWIDQMEDWPTLPPGGRYVQEEGTGQVEAE